MPDFTNDQIKGYADNTFANGGTWADITNAASQHGLTMDQVYGAGVKQPGVPDWLNSLNAGMAHDPTQTSWKDPNSGMTYGILNTAGQEGDAARILYGNGMYTAGQYKPNGQYNILDAQGKDTGRVGQYGNPNADSAYLIAMAAMAAGGIASQYLGAGAGGTSGSVAGGDVGAGSAAFNAAKDSQLANAAITAGGGDALAGYTAAGATPATIAGMGSTGADLGATVAGAGASGGGGATAGGGAAATGAGTIGAGGAAAALPPAVKALLPNGGAGLSLNDIVNLLGGGIDTRNQNKASDDMLNYLKEQQAKIDRMYSDGSPEKALMQQTMDRKDAAAGRMSQYGTRATDLAAKIAQIKADETVRMTTGIGNLYRQSLNQKASAPTGLLSTLSNLANKTGYSVSDIAKWLSNNNWQPDTSTMSHADDFQPENGDLGQYF